ncbi:MAG: excinuclease ABC subunit UvrC [Candidatus Dormibacteraeota bacterium]|uniref:UvrABC system protein C n=1 Tax=Candidatus Amunia macphersoniae TaxID=3127014 RepID=A0A934NFV5_9BACT|nr:excinuclease ABC subunit UvrC [Candidatus Dormibacteraeota bacterium]
MSTQTVTRRARLVDNADLLRARLRAAPTGAGVYVMRDLEGRVAYVGKSASLRSRLRSYFTGVDSLPTRTRTLVERVFDFEVIDCASEREALILENSLIKQYRPRYNVRLKDDKSYLYLKIPKPGSGPLHAPGTAREQLRAPRGEGGVRATEFPRPYYTRRMIRDGARYFGPYTSAQSLRTTVKSLRTIFPFRTCSDEIFARGRVCLDYHIKRCSGPCERRIDGADYATLLDQVELFMQGRSAALEDQLRSQMEDAAGNLDFELAARFRDRLRAIDRIAQRQSMLTGSRADEDCVAVALEGGRAMVALLSVRSGRVMAMETHELEGVTDLGPGECLSGFVPQYYGNAPTVPRTVMVSDAIEDATVVEEFLAEQRDGPVTLQHAQRGRPRELIDQARATALSALRQRRIVDDFDAERTESLLVDLAERLRLSGPPRRIECYDISNTMGTNSVGSMIVFEDGVPRPAHYRHFGIRTVEGSDDFASMEETLRRRFARLLKLRAEGATVGDIPVDDPAGSNGAQRRVEAGRASGASSGDDSFGILPDLVLIDGGKGQLNAAHRVLREAGLTDVAIFGLAKRNEELFSPGVARPTIIEKDSPTLFLVQRVRDEAHRFAITHHRARRAKTALRSRLDSVPGLGPVRKRALLRRFGSIDGIRAATVDELVETVPHAVALSIKELL